MVDRHGKWFSRGVFRVGIVIFRLFQVVGVQQSTISSKAAIFQDGVLEPEVVFQTRFLRRRRDFLTKSDCLGPPGSRICRNPPLSKMAKSAIFQDGDRQPEVVFSGRFSRRNRDFSIVSGCGGATEYDFVDAHTSTGTGSA